VSIIEQAAKRLEELKKAGVEVPDALIEPESDEREHAGDEPSAPRPRRRPTADRIRDTSPPSEGKPVSRSVSIDLANLAAAGYLTPDTPHSPLANEFRVIKRPLLANARAQPATPGGNANLILVTSSIAGEGKSFVALNLAMSIAMELDTRVLLVDADAGSPSFGETLKLPEVQGLMDVLTQENLDLSAVLLRTNVEKLSLLGAGTIQNRATELLASDAMKRLMEELATRYDDRIVIFDSPPLLLTTEARALASLVGQIVVVVEAEQTPVTMLRRALATIESCPVIMTVLNKARASEIGPYYRYGYRHAT
jgi:protein-tyrosine kinase